jgi:tetratricopeptide (TPR) repeat protein
MPKRWIHRLSIATLALGLVATSPALAQNGKIKKAEKMLVKYDGSDTVALAKALDAINKAKVHSKTRDLAHTWVVLGDVHTAYMMDDAAESPEPNPGRAAVDAYMAAVGKEGADAYAERILEAIAAIETDAMAAATEAYESKAYAEAWPALQTVMAAQKVSRQVGRTDVAREAGTLQVAILTAVKRNDLDAARALHDELLALDGVPSATSLALATAMADVDGSEAALAFLEPLSDADPDDAVLMQARIEHLFTLDRKDDVVALLEANKASVGKALAITLLHARAWDRAEDLGRSAEAYLNAQALGPEDLTVLRGYADVEMRRASAFDVSAKATRNWRERRDMRAARDNARNNAMELLREARVLDPDHLATLQLLREVYDDVRLRDREEIAALEEAIAKIEEKAEEEGGK